MFCVWQLDSSCADLVHYHVMHGLTVTVVIPLMKYNVVKLNVCLQTAFVWNFRDLYQSIYTVFE